MSIRLMSQVWDLQFESLGQKMVLLALADNANEQGVCWPSVSTICRKCQCTDRTVQTHLNRLEELKVVKIIERSGHSSLYTITLPTPEKAAPPKNFHPTPEKSSGPPPKHFHPEPSFEPSRKGEGNPHSISRNGKLRKYPSEAALALVEIRKHLQRLKDFGKRDSGGKFVEPDASEWKRLKTEETANARILCEVYS